MIFGSLSNPWIYLINSLSKSGILRVLLFPHRIGAVAVRLRLQHQIFALGLRAVLSTRPICAIAIWTFERIVSIFMPAVLPAVHDRMPFDAKILRLLIVIAVAECFAEFTTVNIALNQADIVLPAKFF